MKKLFLFVIPVFILAVPSNWKEVKTFYQPDGTPIYARLIGDEHFHFFEDMDGYVLVRNNEGWLTYAKKEEGILKPTQYIYGHSLPPYPKHLRPSAKAIAKLPQNKHKVINTHTLDVAANQEKLKQLGKERASSEEKAQILGLTGTNALICLLGAFSDSGFGWVKAGETPAANLERRHFWGLSFGDSVPPFVADSSKYSMNNYYWEATYTKLKWTGDVDTIRNSGDTRIASGDDDVGTQAYISDACAAADPFVNFALYDLDADGDVDQLFVIHPGMGQEESQDANDIWSASWSGAFGTYDGKTVNRAVVIPENAKLGVFCHELFHQYASAPDLYDYDSDGDPVDDYCLMASGSWNNNGRNPPHMCAFLKYECDGTWQAPPAGYLGNAAVLDTAELLNCGKYSITQLDSQPGTTLDNPRMYMVQNAVLRDSGQMFILENRQLTGTYESYLPRSGLLIYQRDRRMKGSGVDPDYYNDGPPLYRYYWVWTHRNLFEENWYYFLSTTGGSDTVQYYPNDYFAPYAADYGYVNFDSASVPNCGKNWRLTTANTWGPSITGISKTSYNMSFNVNRLVVPASGPAIKLSYYTIRDPITAGTNNDNNGVFNAGETDTLILTFYNSSAATTAVQESLYTIDPYITITNPAKRTIIASMAYNTYANDQANPYIIQVAFNAPPNYTAQFKYKVWATSYSDSGEVYIPVNTTKIVWRFRPGAVTHNFFKPMAIAVYYDTMFISDGDSIGVTGATNRVYKFSPSGALITSAARPGAQSYVALCDINRVNNNLYWSIGDSCFQTTRAFAAVNKFRHYNSAWGSDPMKRVRGLTFAPQNAPTGYAQDSLFVYWQQMDGVAPYNPALNEESLIVESRPASGAAVRRAGWVIPEDYENYDNYLNGRGIEHDGWRMWRTSMLTDSVYRARAPVSAASTPTLDTLYSMMNPNHWGVYPGYDLDFQAKNSSGGEPHSPYLRENKFYLWSTNIESSEVFKLDVTNIVQPSPVENVFATRDVYDTNRVIWDEKNYSTNPDTVEKVERYIIYRTDKTNLIGDSIGFYTARTGYEVDTFKEYQPALKYIVYYRVSPVNWFGFIPGYSNRSNGVIGIEEQVKTSGYKFIFYNLNPSITGRQLNLQYEVAEPCAVNLKVYNALGALVRTVVSGNIKPGRYNLVWRLDDNLKRRLASGVYFVKFSTDKGYERTQKLILVR